MLIRARASAVSLCFAALAGCTESMWRSANEKTAAVPVLIGAAAGPLAGQRVLVLSYAATWTEEQDLLSVPVNPDGRPAAPFGLSVESGDVWAHVSAEQRIAVLARATDRPGASPSDGAGLPAVRRYDERRRVPADQSEVSDHLLAIAYGLDQTGRAYQRPFQFAGSGGQRRPQVPPGAHVVLVPWELPRPAAVREAARTRAALLTPVTVTADAALWVVSCVACAIVLPPVLLVVVVSGRS